MLFLETCFLFVLFSHTLFAAPRSKTIIKSIEHVYSLFNWIVSPVCNNISRTLILVRYVLFCLFCVCFFSFKYLISNVIYQYTFYLYVINYYFLLIIVHKINMISIIYISFHLGEEDYCH